MCCFTKSKQLVNGTILSQIMVHYAMLEMQIQQNSNAIFSFPNQFHPL